MNDHIQDAVRILAPDGSVVDSEAREGLDLKEEDLRAMYRQMAVTRQVDLECTALQRQGELAVYPPVLGQEAAQVGSAYALAEEDFVFPSYREVGVAVVRGIDLVDYMKFHRGTRHGGITDPVGKRFAEISVPVSSQTLHAVGWAMGARKDGRGACSIVYFGDGATSQGDFHEACNFAAVFRSPVIFFCQNNGWAISVPLDRQTVAPIWKKAEAYGFPGVRVDGNDVLASYQVTREAAERARVEHTPTLIEAVTYRMGPHSTADDRSRYQPTEEIESWRALDPLVRFRTFLEAEKLIDYSFLDDVERDAKEVASTVRGGIVGAPPLDVREMFGWVFSDIPVSLGRQRDEVDDLLRSATDEGSPDA
ncbi:MAG: pyruvate dehydrogenase (acetyl-transferring) E1 component subunit alpha [Actinomycetota bacterium]|nr:pyruvate dehydrogenase (acetyl-transferring) E1 component subunit alpha [Actinomycetota bacterium]